MSGVEFNVVIPARYESSRLPGKLLMDIAGKSMLQRVVERALASAAKNVIVAVDDERLADHVQQVTSATVVTTSPTHTSGTDRIAEAVQLLKWPGQTVIVNLQGDEPQMCSQLISQVAAVLQSNPKASIGTAAVPMDLIANGNDPNRVKCVVDQNNQALYFSRRNIPWGAERKPSGTLSGLHHIGIYAYTVDYLTQQHASREVCTLERTEGLEQLRALYYGDVIAVHITESYQGIGVDTFEDLERVRAMFGHAN